MSTIATIRRGHRVVVANDQITRESEFEVVGSRSLRGKYLYILRDVHGRKFSMSRETVMLGQQDGTIRVSV